MQPPGRAAPPDRSAADGARPAELARDVVDVEGARHEHVLEIGPVASSVEERLEHREVAAGEERQHRATKWLEHDTTHGRVVELRGAEEDVHGRLVPPQPLLTIAPQRGRVGSSARDLGRHRREHARRTTRSDEHVHIDVARTARALRAPRQGERAPERVWQLGPVERVVHGNDLLDDRGHAPALGMRALIVAVCTLGNASASASTASTSRARTP
jgi:hypothetical protein